VRASALPSQCVHVASQHRLAIGPVQRAPPARRRQFQILRAEFRCLSSSSAGLRSGRRGASLTQASPGFHHDRASRFQRRRVRTYPQKLCITMWTDVSHGPKAQHQQWLASVCSTFRQRGDSLFNCPLPQQATLPRAKPRRERGYNREGFVKSPARMPCKAARQT
jgi:hypothetical protein